MICPRCDTGPAKAHAGPYRDGGGPARAGVALVRERHPAGVEIDRCPSCRGVYLDHGELERVERAPAPRDRRRPTEGERVRRAFARPIVAGRTEADEPPAPDCPACVELSPTGPREASGPTAPMIEREWSIGTRVFVRVCLECRGVWVDGDDFEALQQLFVR